MPYVNGHPDHSFAVHAREWQSLMPNETQRNTLIVAACYTFAICILWHVPVLSYILYPFKLLTVGFHEFSHALAGVLTCARIHSIQLDPDQGGATSMAGGIPCVTLPAGYLGSSLIGAVLIACGFDINASKVASLALVGFFLITLWWARRSLVALLLCVGFLGLFVLFWLVAHSVALRYLILFIGVMSDLYVLWDIIDDTIRREVPTSDASHYQKACGCGTARMWGVLWLIIALIFLGLGVIVGLAAFKDSAAQQVEASKHFLSLPWDH